MRGMEFVNDLCCNYLTIPYEGDEQDFALRMMAENVTNVFLPVELRRIDGRALLYYDISGMQNMEVLYTEKQIDRHAFQTLMWQLHEAMEQSRELFLPGDGICLEPANLFWDWGARRWKLIYIPGRGGDEPESMQSEKEMLAEFLVMHMDHGDKELTETVYRFYEEICAGGGFSRIDAFGEALEQKTSGEADFSAMDLDGESEAEIFSAGQAEEAWDYRDAGKEEAEEEKGSKDSDLGRGKKLQVITGILFVLAAAATAAGGRIMPDVIRPGMAVSGLLAAAFFVISLRQRTGQEISEAEERNMGVLKQDGDIFYEMEGEEEKEKEYAAGEKTVYMDIQRENERKLYGIGKARRQKILLDGLPCLVGKEKGLVNHVISDPSVSRMHARFYEEGKAVWMQDLNSTNGTYHNGMRLKPNEKVILEPEDEVAFGQVQFVFR